MQRFLLTPGAVVRAVPGAVVTALALAAFGVLSSAYLFAAIVWNARSGPVGVVSVLMSWLTYFSLVLLGGAVVGRAVHSRRRQASGG